MPSTIAHKRQLGSKRWRGFLIGIVVLMTWIARSPAYPRTWADAATATATPTPITRYAPLVLKEWPSTRIPTPTLTPTQPPAGDVGLRTIQGTIYITQGGIDIPLAGATVTCSHSSYYLGRPMCHGTTTTALDGSYSFGDVFLHDTDRIAVHAESAGYQAQTIARSGLETYYNPIFNFVLSPS